MMFACSDRLKLAVLLAFCSTRCLTQNCPDGFSRLGALSNALGNADARDPSGMAPPYVQD